MGAHSEGEKMAAVALISGGTVVAQTARGGQEVGVRWVVSAACTGGKNGGRGE
jgi:hypothetical protein